MGVQPEDRPPLEPGATTTYNFVIAGDKQFTLKAIIFSKIVLEGGREADPQKDIQIE